MSLRNVVRSVTISISQERTTPEFGTGCPFPLVIRSCGEIFRLTPFQETERALDGQDQDT